MPTPSSKSTFPKFPNRYAAIILPFLLSIIMTCIVSCISTLKSLGLDGFSLQTWLSAWGISWVVAFPVLLFALPIVRKITAALVEPC